MEMFTRSNNNKANQCQSTEHASQNLSSDTNDPIFDDRKISSTTEGLQPCFEKWLRTRISNKNAALISEYITSLKREINPS